MFKKKQAMKKRGGGMMGPKKKMAKGGKVKRKAPDASLYSKKIKDFIRAKKEAPTGRSAAAKKAAMKGVSTPGKKVMAKIKKGKGNPAGKDLSIKGKLTALMRATPQTGRLGAKGLKKAIERRRLLGGKK